MEPNLQQFPVRSESYAKLRPLLIKSFFGIDVGDPSSFVVGDYSGTEMRIVAAFQRRRGGDKKKKNKR